MLFLLFIVLFQFGLLSVPAQVGRRLTLAVGLALDKPDSAKIGLVV